MLHPRPQLSQPSASPSFSDVITRHPGISRRAEAEEKLLGVGLMELLLSICEKSQLSMSHLYIPHTRSNKISLGKRSALSHPLLNIIPFLSAGEVTHIWFTVLALHVLCVSGVIWFLHRQLVSVVIYLVCSHQLYVIWFNYRKRFIIMGMETMDYVLCFKVITQ